MTTSAHTEKLEQQTKEIAAMETQLEALKQQHQKESESQQQKINELENEKKKASEGVLFLHSDVAKCV